MPLRAVSAILLVAGLALGACESSKPVADQRQAGTATSTVPAPESSPSPSPAPSTAAPSAPPAPRPVAKPKVSKATLNYFYKIALGSEYGDSRSVVAMWARPTVLVKVNGKTTAADRKCLNQVVTEFNALTATTDLQLTTAAGADMQVHFAPTSRFKSILPDYVPGNTGFFWVHWTGLHSITDATVLIATGVSARERCHLIREEITQSMGLMRDAYDYSNSIFYQNYSTANAYSSQDRAIIRLLYSGAVKPGFDKKAISRAVVLTP